MCRDLIEEIPAGSQGLHYIVLSDAPKLPGDPQEVRAQYALRNEEIHAAFTNPETTPGAFVSMQPISTLYTHFFPDFMAMAKSGGCKTISVVRDLCGTLHDTMPAIISQSDDVVVIGGGRGFSDFEELCARNQCVIDEQRVHYVGLLNAPAHDNQRVTPGNDIILQIGASLNDRHGHEKLAIFACIIAAWSHNERLHQHELHLLVPPDATKDQLHDLNVLVRQQKWANKIRVMETLPEEAYYQKARRCALLVSCCGLGVMGNVLQGIPTLLVPLRQASNEQVIRAERMAGAHVVLPTTDGAQSVRPVVTSSEMLQYQDDPAFIATVANMMAGCLDHNRATILENAARHFAF